MKIRNIQLSRTNGVKSIVHFEVYKDEEYLGRFLATLREDEKGKHILLGKRRVDVRGEDAPWSAHRKEAQ